jgi:hypothetical protein
MPAMPASPTDLRVWFLSRVLGWPGRRVATEVGVSQPTVVRTLERLTKDPPTDQEMQDFVSAATTSTPPGGIPVMKTARRPASDNSPLLWAYTGAVIMITLSVTVVLVSLAIAILNH